MHTCHCGAVTSLGAKDTCCLLCRCDEHSPLIHEAPGTDTQPGCGPMCRHWSVQARYRNISRLMSRDISPELAAWYRKLSQEEWIYV